MSDIDPETGLTIIRPKAEEPEAPQLRRVPIVDVELLVKLREARKDHEDKANASAITGIGVSRILAAAAKAGGEEFEANEEVMRLNKRVIASVGIRAQDVVDIDLESESPAVVLKPKDGS